MIDGVRYKSTLCECCYAGPFSFSYILRSSEWSVALLSGNKCMTQRASGFCVVVRIRGYFLTGFFQIVLSSP